MPLLCDLPDEILLEVVRSYEIIRSYETQSTAFKYRGKEKGRQLDNHIRQRALSALCLTSHRLRCISLPTLYASSLSCATWHGLRQLHLFHRTISSPHNAVGQSKRLAEYLQYVENRLADYLGNSLQDDEFYHANSAARYFRLLSDVVLCAPNIQHLCVVSLEHAEVSFWNYLLPKWNACPSTNMIGHGLTNLKHLCVQVHSQGQASVSEAALFERIILTLHSLPILSDLRVSGADSNVEATRLYPLGDLPNVRRLELTECSLEFSEVTHLLSACKDLRYFSCKWAFLNYASRGPSSLYPALIVHAKTLEALTLDLREVRYDPRLGPESKILGSLRPFISLEFLEICETSFLRSNLSLLDVPDQTLDHEMSALLPPNLEQLTLLVNSDYGNYDDNPLDEVFVLWQLAYDCKTSLPHLKTLYVNGRYKMSAPNLVRAFRKAGVRFDTEKEE
jgi:hypothetical protein